MRPPAIILLALIHSVFSTEEILVEIPDGKLRGNAMLDRKGGTFYAFQSIPYGKPPVGDLRFKPPQPAEPWTDTKDATGEITKCVQNEFGNIFGTEDCLHLNVYTPEVSETNLKPVMFYIHKGAFYFGSGTITRIGPHHLLTDGVVLVAINYRLGIMGFLSADDPDTGITANNGLRDQILALKWVQKNIRYFGGDPDRVTVFGDSAGGASTNLLMLSPMSKGLFHGAIAQSGCALCAWALGANNTAIPLAENLGIDTSDPKAMGHALRQASPDAIIKSQGEIDWSIKVNSPWRGGVVVEGPGPNSVLPHHPIEIIRSGDFHKVPLMIGYTNKEGILMELFIKLLGFKYDFDLKFDVPYDLSQGREDVIAAVIERMKDHYFGGDLPKEIDEDLIEVWTDVWFKHAEVRVAREHSKFHEVYLYEFSADTKLNFFKRLHPDTRKYKGACHVDDLGYIFKDQMNPDIEPNSIEDRLSSRSVRLWTNFAKFGKPTVGPDPVTENAAWLPVSGSQLNYVTLDDSLTPGILSDRNLEFWDEIYAKYSN